MKQVFLGKLLHWALVAIIIAAGFALGKLRLHVTDFNLYLGLLVVAAAALLALVLATSGRNERVTRDPIPEPTSDHTEE